MRQTDHTAIVLRHVNYREHDRMLTLFSPTRGRIEAISRGCRRARSPLLSASELFALGEYELYAKGGHHTVVSAALTETFYPLRRDLDRLTCGMYLLELTEAAILPGVASQELFMLLLHTLSRLTYSEQAWRPLLTGYLLHYAACEGYRPELEHCVRCGRSITDVRPLYFDLEGGGVCCPLCRRDQPPVEAEQLRWMRHALTIGSAGWVEQPGETAPLSLLRRYVESRLERRIRSGAMLPE